MSTTRDKRGPVARIVAGVAVAVVAAAPISVGLGVTPALAAGATISLSPGALTPVVANLGHATPAAAATAYAMKITDAALPALTMAVISAPANGRLAVEKVASNGAAIESSFTDTAAGAVTSLGSAVSTDNIFVAGDVPGTYVARLFQDTLANGQFDPVVERTSEPITVTVADAGGTGTTTTTADDVKLNLSAEPSLTAGMKIPLKIAYSTPLSLTDARGTGADGLGSALAALTVVDVPGVAGLSAKVDQPSVYSPATGIGFTTEATTIPGSVGLRADLVPGLTSGDDNSTVSFGQKVVDVLSGAVTDVTSTTLSIDPAAGQGATLKRISPQRVLAKAGATTATFVGALDGGSDDPSGQSMVFGLVPGAGTVLKDLKVNGAGLPGTGLVPTTTGDDGQSMISVGSKALPGSSYYLTATSQGVTADLDAAVPGNQPLMVSFAAPVPTSLSILGDVTQVTGGTTTLTGSVLDQWGAALKPATGDMTLTVLRDGGAAITKQVPIGSDGTFSTTVSDIAGNVASRADTYTWQLGALKTDPAAISWGGSQAASHVAITGIGSVTTIPAPRGTSFDVAVAPDATAAPSPVAGATHVVMVTGTVTDVNGTALPATPFVMKATDGTYLLDAAGMAHETLVGLTGTTGKITDGTSPGVRALFTRSGPASVSVSSGSASATTGSFTVASPVATSDYQVALDPLSLEPGEGAPVAARVLDGFGNPVAGASVDLSLPADAAGEFSGDVTGLVTDAEGEVSAVLSSVGSSGQEPSDGEDGEGGEDGEDTGSSSGGLEVTATINGGAVDPSPVTNLLGTGLAVVAGANEATRSALVTATKLGLSAPSAVSGLGKAVVTGTAPASSLVNVYAKRIGDSGFTFLQTVTTDSAGSWKLSTPLTRTTTFLAKAGDVASPPDTTVLNTVADVSGKALGGGKVRLVVDGQPNIPGTVDVTLGGKKLVKGLKTDADGDRTVVVKAPKGKKVFTVLFRATGASARTAKETVTVK